MDTNDEGNARALALMNEAFGERGTFPDGHVGGMSQVADDTDDEPAQDDNMYDGGPTWREEEAWLDEQDEIELSDDTLQAKVFYSTFFVKHNFDPTFSVKHYYIYLTQLCL